MCPVVNFDEEYFDDPNRTELFVYLSAMVDKEIFSFLNQVYFLYNIEILRKK